MIPSIRNSSVDLKLSLHAVSKEYDLRPVLLDISCELRQGDIVGITGKNGAGKSTLMKVIANVLERTSGEVSWSVDQREISEEDLPPYLGFVSPYLNLYTEFSGYELLNLLNSIRGTELLLERTEELISHFGLKGRFNDHLASYSSGMLQRAKYILALAHQPHFLLLDEPMTNLDSDGIEAVRTIVQMEKESRITIIATNDPEDLSLCTSTLPVGLD